MKGQKLHRAGFEALLAAGGYLPVVGESMAPVVARNASVRVEPCDCSDLRPGDVVLAECEEKFVMHRFLAEFSLGGRRRLLLKADRRWRPDAPLPVEGLIGRLVEIRDARGLRTYSPRLRDRVRAAAAGLFWTLLLRSGAREVRTAS